MTTEALENLIEDPEVFALGIDSSPIRDVLVEIATRVDVLQLKIAKAKKDDDSFDNGDIHDINVRLNELNKRQDQQFSDFTTEITDLKQFFQYQMKDLRDSTEKSNKQLNEKFMALSMSYDTESQIRLTQSNASLDKESENNSRAATPVIPQNDNIAIKKLAIDVQSLRDKIDSLVSTIDTIKDDSFKNSIIEERPLMESSRTERSSIPEVPSSASINSDSLKGLKSIDPVSIIEPLKIETQEYEPEKIEDQHLELELTTNKTLENRVDDLYKRMETVFNELNNNRNQISSIKKTTNKIIVEVDSQQNDMKALNKQSNEFVDEFEKIREKITDVGFDADKRLVNLQTLIDNLASKENEEKGKEADNQTHISGEVGPNMDELPDFEELLASIKKDIEKNIKDVDTNFRTQIHYMKQEMTNMKTMIQNINEGEGKEAIAKIETISQPEPEMKPPPSFKPIQTQSKSPRRKEQKSEEEEKNEPVESIPNTPIKRKETPKKPLFKTKNKEEEEETKEEPKQKEEAKKESPRKEEKSTEENKVTEENQEQVEHPQHSTVTVADLIDIETMTNPSELGEIPVTRVSFGTPLTSVPNEIQTQFIADRKPSEMVRKVSLKQINDGSTKYMNISSNTPPYQPDMDGADLLGPEVEQCIVESSDFIVPKNSRKRANTAVIKQRKPQTVTIKQLPAELKEAETGVEKVDTGNNSGEMNVDRETTPGSGFVEVVDSDTQTEISVYKTIGTTPIHTRQQTAIKSHRSQNKIENPEAEVNQQQEENNEPEEKKTETEENKPETTVEEKKEEVPEKQETKNEEKSDTQKPTTIKVKEEKKEETKEITEPNNNSDLFAIDNANEEDLQYMEQYNVSGNMFSSHLGHESPVYTPKKTSNAKAAFSFERMLVLDIVTEVKAAPAPIIIESKGDGGNSDLSQNDKDEIIKKISEITQNQKMEELESTVNHTKSEVATVQSKVNQIPDDLVKRFTNLQETVRRWVENCSILHKKVTELSGMEYGARKKLEKRISFTTTTETKDGTISIPPSSNIESINKTAQKAVLKPEIVIEMKNQPKPKEEEKPKNNMFVFSRIEMIDSPPSNKLTPMESLQSLISFDTEDIKIEQDSLREKINQATTDVDEVRINISRLENDIFSVAHELEEYKVKANSVQPQTIEYYYVNNVKVSKEEALNAQGEIEKAKQEEEVKELQKQVEVAKQKAEEAAAETTTAEKEEEGATKQSIEERLKEAGKEMQDQSNINKNVLLWEMQPCNAFFVDSSVKDQGDQGKVDIDVDTLAIPRYDEQFRIMRDALVDMRTNQQIHKQRTEEKFQQIIQKQIAMAANGSESSSERIVQFKKSVESKLDEYAGEFNALRQELYQFMKDRPERIIEKIKEVVVQKIEGAKTEKKKRKPKKKEEAPPPPPPPADLDIDLQIKKKKKLIGEIESPRIFNIRPMELETPALSDSDSEPSSPIIDPETGRPTFPRKSHERKRLPIIDTEYSNDDDDTPVNLTNQESGTEKSSVLPSDSPSRADEGHVVPQLIDEVSVYNALPKTDYTEKLVPMLMKMRDELMTYIDKSNRRTLKAEKKMRNKCDKDYVESFFRKIRVVLTNYDERLGVLTKALPLRVTKDELEDKFEDFRNEMDRFGYQPQPGGNGTFSRCLFCGSKLPPGKVDLPNPEAVGGRQIPPKTNIVSDHGVVYKGRASNSVMHSQALLPKLNPNPKQPEVSSSLNQAPEMPSCLPKL